jgi:hypothetical protein
MSLIVWCWFVRYTNGTHISVSSQFITSLFIDSTVLLFSVYIHYGNICIGSKLCILQLLAIILIVCIFTSNIDLPNKFLNIAFIYKVFDGLHIL